MLHYITVLNSTNLTTDLQLWKKHRDINSLLNLLLLLLHYFYVTIVISNSKQYAECLVFVIFVTAVMFKINWDRPALR